MNRSRFNRREVHEARARLYATDKQIRYLAILLNEAFANLYSHGLCLDPRQLARTTREYASAAIAQLLRAKSRGWAGE